MSDFYFPTSFSLPGISHHSRLWHVCGSGQVSLVHCECQPQVLGSLPNLCSQWKSVNSAKAIVWIRYPVCPSDGDTLESSSRHCWHCFKLGRAMCLPNVITVITFFCCGTDREIAQRPGKVTGPCSAGPGFYNYRL